MALLKPTLLFSVSRRTLGSSKVLGAHWNKEWKPAQYPETEISWTYGLVSQDGDTIAAGEEAICPTNLNFYQVPLTEEEKAAAAKKYGLLREEYKPIPNDGDGAGDYPDFKPYAVQGRDPHYPWDFPEYRRNFNEALHADFNMYTEDKWNCEQKLRWPMSLMLAAFLTVMGGTYYVARKSDYTFFMPAMPKHMPAPGVTHYKYSQE